MKTIKLTQGKETIVCDCHYDLVKGNKWYYSGSGYAVRKQWAILCKCGCKGMTSINMHRVINSTPNGMQTDHINRDRLDNRCSNLRSATVSQNLTNRGGHGKSGYKFVHRVGVLADRGLKCWQARHRENPEDSYTSLGMYATPEEANAVVQEFIKTKLMPSHPGKKYRNSTRAKYKELQS